MTSPTGAKSITSGFCEVSECCYYFGRYVYMGSTDPISELSLTLPKRDRVLALT